MALKARSPAPVKRTHFAWRLVRIALMAYVGVALLLMLFENRLVYFPAKYPIGNWTPADLPYEDVELEADDGTALHAWYIPHDAPRAWVLFLHGNAGNIALRGEFLRRVHDLRVSVLALDYRGYGKSDGSASEAGVMADGRAARAWLAAKAGIAEQDVLLWGESLGTAVAIELATEGARGLILENAFTSLPDVAAYHYAWLPVKWVMRNRMPSIEKIGTVKAPILQAHGDADTIIPYELGRRLFEAAGEPKEFVTIAGGDHNDARSPRFWEAVDRFLERLKN